MKTKKKVGGTKNAVKLFVFIIEMNRTKNIILYKFDVNLHF